MAFIKICGLKREADIQYANVLLPEYIGFVFSQSRRRIDAVGALELRKRLDKRIKSVGVFVQEEITLIKELCEAGIIDLVQLHGEEDTDYMDALQREISKPLIRAVRVRGTEDILNALEFPCEFLLLDTYTAQEAGGSGKMFNHRMIPHISKPFFLAGGLHSGNVAEAIAAVHPYAVDVSSGVEEGGSKQKDKMEAFVRAVRNAPADRGGI